MNMIEAARALAVRKEEIGFRTASIFFRQPMAEKLRGKETITMLDFGCGDSLFTIGAIRAVAARFNPVLVQAYGVNAEPPLGGCNFLELSFGRTGAVYAILDPVMVARRKDTRRLMTEFGLPVAGLDMVTVFNPSPPDELFDNILRARNAMLAGIEGSGAMESYRGRISAPLFEVVSREFEAVVAGGRLPEVKMKMRKEICQFLVRTFDIAPGEVEGLGMNALLDFAKRLCLERPLREVIPEFVGNEGLLFMAFDNLYPKLMVRTAVSAGFDIRFERENDPENMLEPGVVSFNAHLLGATRKK